MHESLLISSTNSENYFYEVALGHIPGVGNHLAKQLISYCGSAKNVFTTRKGRLLQIPGVGDFVATSIIEQNVLKIAEQQLKLAEKHHVAILPYTHPDYPQRLKNTFDFPALLYYKGNTNLNAAKILAIVGTRNATEYGKEITSHLVTSLSERHPEILIVSGLAYGIDLCVHQVSVSKNVATVGVMGNGIDKIYPSVHRPLASKMTEAGGILTEYPFGTKADAHNFPARNRIVAGMSDALVVVEAAAKGGALITAEIANEYNREVFAVPGNIGAKYSEGCNNLIRDHKAIIYTNVESLEIALGWDQSQVSLTKQKEIIDFSNFSAQQQAILIEINVAEGLQLDELSWKTNIPVNQLSSLLLTMEFDGFVKALPGKRFKASL